MTNPFHDPDTLAFYDREAEAYANRGDRAGYVYVFLERLAKGATILELGCGGGQDAEAMLAEGFDVDATDGSPGLAAQAERRIGRPVRVMLFEELEAVAAYDAVWANASLLHVPLDGLAAVLARVRRALKPGGLFYAGYKAGDGGGRDALGRYFNFPTEQVLRAAYEAAGPWGELELRSGPGGGYDREPRVWLHVIATT
ncbi:bifunctional 2-polyprenyl-6-hydroxyphenol methylase/3-demethylubiquinol 3-O-methyltransferase UbiG [Phenylobacterium sp.]|uniref:class I SAM-dependent methyltransferase n=1 Tax=Phenylobacterium sp. TaxID=1871053 RepID=UPI00273631DE|nr:class I SAM-dependent methyltransferase [Phenylobacterium sp.]MDP3852528.1 class I SAM-dependent methyltransferase [Phenylobacterium sp.]